MNPELEQLKKQVDELLEWKRQKELQQISSPLDEISRKIIQDKLIVVKDYGEFVRADGSVGDYFYFVDIGGKTERLSVNFPMYQFTANASTDTITIIGLEPSNDDAILVMSTGTLPSGLSESTPYYVINASGNTCKLSESLGGAAVDIIDTGTGTHYTQRY